MKKEIKTIEKVNYVSPDIEVVNIETEQNILQAGSNNLHDMPGEDW